MSPSPSPSSPPQPTTPRAIHLGTRRTGAVPARPRLAVVAVVVVALGALWAQGIGIDPASATPTQSPTSEAVEPLAPELTESSVPAPAPAVDEGNADEGTTSTDTSRSATTTPDSSEIDAENRKLALIVAGLVAVAIALTLLTIRYWRVTKPAGHRDAELGDGSGDVPGDGAGGVAGDVAGDGAELASDESVDRAGEIHGAPAVEPDPDASGDELFVPRTGRRSRRAVAGADHAGVGSGWEPMATGEQERVSGQIPRVTARPSPSDRARALRDADQG